MLECPRCEIPLRLVVDTNPARTKSFKPKPRHFRIGDLLGVTALIAMHFAAFRYLASSHIGELAALLWLTPTVLTCLLHLRFRLKITTAMVVFYCITLLYTFLATLGQNAAINSYRLENPSEGRDTEIAIFEYATSETVTMAFMGIALTIAYGMVCYTAINARAPSEWQPSLTDSQHGG